MKKCEHNNISSGSGGYFIFCNDCGKEWIASLDFPKTFKEASDTVEYMKWKSKLNETQETTPNN